MHEMRRWFCFEGVGWGGGEERVSGWKWQWISWLLWLRVNWTIRRRDSNSGMVLRREGGGDENRARDGGYQPFRFSLFNPLFTPTFSPDIPYIL